MSNKQLIVRLIQQDLKHCQLLFGLNRIGLDGDEKHHLQIFDIIYELMKVPESIELDWGVTYQNYMKQVSLIEIEQTDAHLKLLAELCYKHLRTLVQYERKQLKL